MKNKMNPFEKYQLPDTVRVKVQPIKEGGFYAKLPDYPGCMTEADDLFELTFNITDAVLTYFKVPRKEAKRTLSAI